MTDPDLMDADCIHGIPWYDCTTCDADLAVEITNPFAIADSPAELLALLAGAASVCWEHPEGAGVFDVAQANALVDAALERLIELGWA